MVFALFLLLCIYSRSAIKLIWAWPVPNTHSWAGNASVNILPTRGGGGHTRNSRKKTIPDRREFDILMESGSRVIDFGRFLHPRTQCTKQAQGWGFRQKWLSLGWGFRLQTLFVVKFAWGFVHTITAFIALLKKNNDKNYWEMFWVTKWEVCKKNCAPSRYLVVVKVMFHCRIAGQLSPQGTATFFQSYNQLRTMRYTNLLRIKQIWNVNFGFE